MQRDALKLSASSLLLVFHSSPSLFICGLNFCTPLENEMVYLKGFSRYNDFEYMYYIFCHSNMNTL